MKTPFLAQDSLSVTSGQNLSFPICIKCSTSMVKVLDKFNKHVIGKHFWMT